MPIVGDQVRYQIVARNTGSARCQYCGAEYRLFTIFNRDMQGLCSAWKGRHERSCKNKTPKSRRAWAKKYAGQDFSESSLVVDLDHIGFQDLN